MATASATFTQSTYVAGSIITCDFTWTGGFTCSGYVAYMKITDPNGTIVAHATDVNSSYTNYPLTYQTSGTSVMGTYTGYIEVSYNASCFVISSTASCILKTVGYNITVSAPALMNFGNVAPGNCSASQAWTITSNGGGTAPTTISLTGTNTNQFTLTGGGTFNIANNSSVTASVVFCPTSTGAKTASLHIVCLLCTQTIDIPLSGNGSTGITGNCSWEAASYKVGETMTCHFTWTGASPHSGTGVYAIATIYNPSGGLCGSSVYFYTASGSYDMTCVASVTGTYQGEMDVSNGSTYPVMSTCNVTVLAGTVIAELEATSLYYSGPFAPGQTNVTVASLDIKNVGTTSGTLSWQCYSYPNQTGEALLTSGTSTSAYAAGAILSGKQMIVTIPTATGAIPFGVKVKGATEASWPAWGLGLNTFTWDQSFEGDETNIISILAGVGAVGLISFLIWKAGGK